MIISVIIPTLQCENHLPGLLKSLSTQSIVPDEIIIVDSSSTDKTVQTAIHNNCIVKIIDRSDFRHGVVRNLGATMAHGDILVFLTQDALPGDSSFIEKLVDPILNDKAVASYARQLPYPDANPIEAFARKFNYPGSSTIKTIESVTNLGIKAYYFSDSASAISRKGFDKVGGFSEHLIANEDMDLCVRLIRLGYPVIYQAESIVYHSHNYKFIQLFKRYFDIGVYFSQSQEIFQNIKTENEGLKYSVGVLRFLVDERALIWVPRLFIELALKFIGFNLGKYQKLLPKGIKPKLSAQPYFWY